MTFESFSSPSTKKFAEALAKKLLARGPKKRGATVLALHGELGAGKTTFVQGFFKGLGIKRHVTSPTFILMRRTTLPQPKRLQRLEHLQQFTNVFHLDFYRIHHSRELANMGLRELFATPSNIILIEWPERAPKLIPKGAIRISFHHGAKENERKIEIQKRYGK